MSKTAEANGNVSVSGRFRDAETVTDPVSPSSVPDSVLGAWTEDEPVSQSTRLWIKDGAVLEQIIFFN
jgi:hypothetical protein